MRVWPRTFCSIVAALTLSHPDTLAACQGSKPSEPAPTLATAEDIKAGSGKLLLKDGTPIKLKLARGVYSKYAKAGDEVDYLVEEEVLLKNKIVVPEAAIAKGKVMAAEHKRRMGRGGKIDISADSIQLFNSQTIPLRAVQHGRGGGQGLDMAGGMLAAAALTLGVGAPFALLMHGKDIEIRQGSVFTAFVDGDVWLEDIAFPTKASFPTQLSATKTANGSINNSLTAELTIVSVPRGAEVEFDGVFVGSAPETIKAYPGDHMLILRKKGYNDWQRTIRIAGIVVNVEAELVLDSN